MSHLIPQIVTGSSNGQFLLIVDDRTRALLHQIPVNVSSTLWFLDDPSDYFYIVDQLGAISIVDAHAGRLVAQAEGCSPGGANAVESHLAGHLFLGCQGGGTEMHDARTGRLLRSINTGGLGDCTCRRIADDRTGRVFVPGSNGLDVLDARTGALIRALPIRTWDGGSFELDAYMGAVTDLDSRTGNVIIAPYHAPGSGPPSREVLLLDGRTGAITHRWPVPANPLAVLVNPLTHHLLVASAGLVDAGGAPVANGTLSVLDMGTGAILRQIEVGILPGELFADQRAKRLLVINRTTTLSGAPLQQSYFEGQWPRTERWLKGMFGWLPLSAPPAPSPPTDITVSLLDLTRL